MTRLCRRVVVLLAAGCLTAAVAPPSFAADLRVPRLEMVTRGFVVEDRFQLATLLDLELAIEGGYKFAADVGFSFESENIEDTTADQVLRFSYARATTRSLFGAPIDLTYFTGAVDRFASGRELHERFGTARFDSWYYGYRFFPDGVRYDGIHGVEGTGLRLRGPTASQRFNLDGYIYQDQRSAEPGVFSAEIRSMLNLPQVKLEAFAGTTFPEAEAGAYRAGGLLFFDTGAGGQFLAQVGLPYWAPWSSGDELDLDSFYVLIEPRIYLESFGVSLTLFWHPATYELQPTAEDGAVDINVKLLVGDLVRQTVYGGIDNGIALRPDSEDEIRFSLAPFLRVATSGVIWDFALRTRIYPFDMYDSFEAFLGIRTEF